MGIKERRDAEKAEMRKKIMEAAIELIEHEGYENLSLRKIAAKIQYSPTTIYLYYKDKAEIISDMCDELYQKVIYDTTAILDKNTSLSEEEQVRLILTIFIKGLCSEPEMVKAVMYSGVNVIFAGDGEGSIPSNPGIEIFDHLISKGITKKIFNPNIENISWMIVSAMLGFVMSATSNRLNLDHNFDQLAERFVNILMQGIML